MRASVAALLFGASFFFTAANAAFAYQPADGRAYQPADQRWMSKGTPVIHISQSVPQTGVGLGQVKQCRIGAYIHWTCRSDQNCGETAGACR